MFHDPFAIELIDDREDYGEERYVVIGVAVTSVVVVVYSERDDRYRIISARKAEPNEQRFYHESNR
jgi:uncharacterized DUF497 family protein